MRIKWLGHSCFLITADSGATLLTDPYDASGYQGTLLYGPLDESPDVVTVSHGHADHNGVEGLKGRPYAINGLGGQKVEGFDVRGVGSFHDAEQGSMRGGNIIYVITVEGITLCHLGDLGHELSHGKVEEIGAVDVLLLPVGGNFTVGADGATAIWQHLKPAVTIPMHFRNDRCLFSIDGVEKFLEGKTDVEMPAASEISLTKESLPAGPKIIVLDPAN